MRVIAGRWRGRRLTSPVGNEVRPTSDRTKEALFSILGADVTGAVVVDLCCGAGGLGLEALSRGAARAIFVDKASAALSVARRNVELCGPDAGTWDIVQSDGLRWLRGWRGAGGQPWLVLCDPPYASRLASEVLRYLDEDEIPSGFRGAVVEYGKLTPGLTNVPPGWRVRCYGESQLAIRCAAGRAPRQEIE